MRRGSYLLARSLVRGWVRMVPRPVPGRLLHWYAVEVGRQFQKRGLR